MTQQHKAHGISIQWGLIGIVISCWIIPIALILYSLGSYTFRNIENQVADTISASVENAARITENALNAAIESSRAVSYDNTIRTAYNQFLDDQDEITLYSEITSYLTWKFRYDNQFRTTFLFFYNYPETLYYANNNAISSSFTTIREYRAFIHQRVSEEAPKIGTGIGFLVEKGKIYLMRNLVDSTFTPYAVLVMELNQDNIFESPRSVVWLENATVYFEDMPVLVRGEAAVPIPDGQIGKDTAVIERQDNHFHVFETKIVEGQNISFAFTAQENLLSTEMPRFKNLLVLIALLTIPLIGLVGLLFYRWINKPVRTLVEAAQHIEQGEIGYQIAKIPSTREFSYLAEEFNTMSVELKSQFERSYLEQAALQDARIAALQSQINPHFLNNTLEIINWEARIAGDENVSKMIEALSTMLSSAISRDGDALIPLSQELSYVDAYLYITSVRLGSRLRVTREIDERLTKCKTPRLILQPVVENAVEHGISTTAKGAITLRLYEKDAQIIIEVENDHALSEADRLAIEQLLAWDGKSKMQTSSGHLGIRNVNARLKILYGKQNGLSIFTSPTGSTIARLKLPKLT